MKLDIEKAIVETGDRTSIIDMQPVSGGSINQAFYVRTKEREYFAKINKTASEHFFLAEKKGLERLRNNGLTVPNPILLKARDETEMVFLMEWIRSIPSDETGDRALGSLVAKMHQQHSDQAGLNEPNFIGDLTQLNSPSSNWVTFYRDLRLGAMQEFAIEKGRLSKERDRRLTKLRQRLDSIIGHKPSFSLLHGDLWDGNWLYGENGQAYLIDPAVYFGDREVDIAFTYLFGGYSKTFYKQYGADYPLEKEYEDRIPIYQLYYLLVHLILFGESYGSAVDRILQKYTF